MRARHPPLAWLVLGLLGAGGLAAQVETLAGLAFGPLAPREVRIYLPPGGVQPTTPLLVALDGQNLSAWRLEEVIAGLAARGTKVLPLVVAIPSGSDRIEEYGMAGTPDYAGRGTKAAEFQHFVLEAVIPAVRARYRLAPDAAHTGIMGASLGGLAAFDLAWHHPEVFGFAGIFSGSFWWRAENSTPAARQASRLAHRLVRESPRPARVRLWFSAGTREETDDRDGNGVIDAVQDTAELVAALEQRGFRRGPDLAYVEIPGGEHNEATWAQAMPGFLEWLGSAR